ncbi:MAG: ABC transporter substrate-binding protein, partial [Ktedonobacteraceae bacterium]
MVIAPKLRNLALSMAVGIAGVLILSSLQSVAQAAQVKVGAILSIEGRFSSLGVPEQEGIELAIAQINKSGGIGGKQIGLVVYDDGGDQAKAAELANRLIFQDKVPVVFGPSITPTAQMVSPLLEQNGVVEVGFVAQDYLWRGTKYIFMSLPSDAVNAEAMVLYAKNKLRAKTIAITYSNVPYGVNGDKFINQMAQRHGVKVVAAEKWGDTDIDFTPQAGRLKQANADAILVWGSCAPNDAQFVKAVRDAGVTAPFIGNLCMSSPQVPQIAGKTAEGMVSFSVLDYGHPDAETKAFLQAFKEKFGQTPIPFAATSYDGVRLWAKAVERANGKTDPASVAAAMIGLKYKGVSGEFDITKDNHNG